MQTPAQAAPTAAVQEKPMSAPADFDAMSFRKALGSFATGVTIVTTCDAEGNDIGLTANSFNSVSLDPPMVLWSLAKTSKALDAFMNGDNFAVHILSSAQQDLSGRFARSGADKFAGLTPSRGVGGIPLLDDCSARFQCKTTFRYEGGDHVIFVGEVTAFDHNGQPPLVFHSGAYKLIVDKLAQKPAVENDGSFSKNFLGYLLGSAYQQIFAGIRLALQNLQLDEDDYLILSVLGICDPRTPGELDALLRLSGRHVGEGKLRTLCGRGLLVVENDAQGNAQARLSDDGRQLQIQLAAVAKAGEADLENELDESEVLVLKNLLKRLVRGKGENARLLWRDQPKQA
ncbi:flavin reductase [Pseudomonas citronellolis]|uniref:Flavin reductase n=1 Tax=Pseudomonas citronellolis TaxID=53408 RepID=A0AAW6P5Y0_9PSED|nr:flavin reductase [Pseudomonas citronellolis]MDF3842970.1 flavin reductase [Pseudomonas citronellolis]